MMLFRPYQNALIKAEIEKGILLVSTYTDKKNLPNDYRPSGIA